MAPPRWNLLHWNVLNLEERATLLLRIPTIPSTLHGRRPDGDLKRRRRSLRDAPGAGPRFQLALILLFNPCMCRKWRHRFDMDLAHQPHHPCPGFNQLISYLSGGCMWRAPCM